MRNKLAITILSLFFFGVITCEAAKVILKEGKVLHGKIVSEDDEEIFMILGTNMTLRVDKSKIKEIIRPKKKKKKANVVTMDDIRAKEAEKEAKKEGDDKKGDEKVAKDEGSKKEDKKEAEKPEKKKAVDERGLKNLKAGTLFRESKKKGMSIHETKIIQTYDLKSKKFEDVSDEIFSRSKGKGFKTRFGRFASQTKMEASWVGTSAKEGSSFRWKNIILLATMTTTGPLWNPKRDPSEDDVKSWNDLFSEFESQDMGRTGLYLQALARLGDSMSALRKPSEKELQSASEKLFNKSIKQVEKRQDGFDRRNRKRTRKPSKPTEK